jgi:SpoVK/Ycf46/Vps4 family AAA+-type ATPase
MGDIVKDRDLPKENNSHKELEDTIKEIMNKKTKKNKKNYDDWQSNELIHQNNNLSYFLNILDGLNECPGRIIIMTTNKPEYLDAALVRPGRIDFKINMTKATLDDIKNILEHYWNTLIHKEIPNNWEKKISHAEVVSCCRMSDNIEDSFFKINKFITSEYDKLISESPLPSIHIDENNEFINYNLEVTSLQSFVPIS